MTNGKTLIKGLMGATALTLVAGQAAWATGPNYAPNSFTAAGAAVDNTFQLDYEVGGTPQDQITPTAPTTFNVDRLINVTVSSNGDTTVVPGATEQTLEYTLVNTGNDAQTYTLAIEELTGDSFDTDDNTTPGTAQIQYYIDTTTTPGAAVCDDAAPTLTDYVAGTLTPSIPADGVLCVVVTQDIPSTGVVDTNTADVVLVANTAFDNAGTIEDVQADGDGNNTADLTAVENVFADAAGTATGDVAADGDHSATGTYIVATAALSAVKTVEMVNDNVGITPVDCTNFGLAKDPADYFVPGSCIEYTIEVTNAGSQDATNVDLSDTLPDEVTFVAAQISATGWSTAPTITTSPATCTATSTCTVTAANGVVDAASGGTNTVASLIIRALVE